MSRIETREYPIRIDDDLTNAHFFRVEAMPTILEDIAQFLDQGQAPEGM